MLVAREAAFGGRLTEAAAIDLGAVMDRGQAFAQLCIGADSVS